jgi:hypothetical protein
MHPLQLICSDDDILPYLRSAAEGGGGGKRTLRVAPSARINTAPSSPPSSSESHASPRPNRAMPPSKVPETDFGALEKVVAPAAEGKVVVAAADAEAVKRRAARRRRRECIGGVFCQ